MYPHFWNLYPQLYPQALDETESSYETLKQYKWVSGAIEKCTRAHNVLWTVHLQIASLPKEKQAVAIQQAANEDGAWYVSTPQLKGVSHAQ